MEPLLSYFRAEKQESLLFLLVGLAAMLLSGWLVARGSSIRAMAIPLVVVALIQLVVGGSVYARTDRQVAELQERFRAGLRVTRASEMERMDRVMLNFRIYKAIEVAILALGLALTFLAAKNSAAYAAGIGCVIQAAFMLVLDLFAERRGELYLAWLRGMT